MAIACVYCGGAHDTPAEVKACWNGASGDAPVPAREGPADVDVAVDVAVAAPAPLLGRSVVVAAGAAAPEGWAGTERVTIDEAALSAPAAVLSSLREAAHGRRPLVIEICAPIDDLSAASESRPLHELGPRFAFDLDELGHLVFSNSVDVRRPDRPRWPLVERAVALGARPGGRGDVVLPDGTEVWLDGGPVRFTAPIDGAAVLHALAVEHGSLTPPRSNDPVADLAPDQVAAVGHAGGAARIIAPAGSGKTRVLTERARHLLEHWRLPSSAVSLVAFNKRAQEEMRERTADLPGLQVRTLNAIALAIVNGNAPFAPQHRRWRTIDEPDVRRIIGKLVSFPKRRNTDPIAPWIEALGLVRLGLVDPAEVEIRYGGDVDGLTEVWPRYRSALEREGAVDFDDQIFRAIEILLTQPAARAAAQRASRVMLVDEFQDLTPAHLLLVRLLAAPGGAVFGVGDDDQTIYGYNGADPAWLIDFSALFPGAGAHPLEVNYRCPDGVVEAVERLLRHNRRRVPKVIRAATQGVRGWAVVADADPVAASVVAVRSALAEGIAPSDIAVLTRVNASLAPVQVALTTEGAAVSGGVGLEFADRTAVRSSLAWLRLASVDTRGRFLPDDLHEALRRPSRPLHPRIADWVAEQSVIDGLRRLAARLNNERDTERLTAFADDIERLGRLVSGGATTSEVIAVLVDEIGLAGSVATLDATRRGMNRAAQGDDLGAVRHLARLHDDPATFEPWLRDQLGVRRDPAGVVLSTVHRVKGQEWPVVVLHEAAADQFPHRLADDVEEERRLFHVALTRASQLVTVVTGPRPSPFVAELTTEPPAVLPDADGPTRRSPTGSARGVAASNRATVDDPLLDRGQVVAAPGMVLVDQGTEWLVVDVDAEAAVAVHGGATRRFPVGRAVESAGRQRGPLVVPGADVPPVAAAALDELRRFRERARQGKPAYTVFDDKTLVAIARALPGTLEQLARIRGVGPAKLEQYGDDVLGVVAACTSAADPV
jgi:DNA helicase-2/ATP-dependent DNA helicase PcrA